MIRDAGYAHLFLKTNDRITNGANQAILNIIDPTHMVDDGKAHCLVKKAIDGKIAAQCVFFRSAVTIVPMHIQTILAALIIHVWAAPKG